MQVQKKKYILARHVIHAAFCSSTAPPPTMQNPSIANRQNKKMALSSRQRVYLSTPAHPVSATPTHMLRICVNSPCLGDADRVRFANRSIPAETGGSCKPPQRLDLNFKMCIKDLFTSARSVKHQKENLRQEVLFFIFTLRFQPHLLRKPPSLQPQIPIRLRHLLRLP